MPSSFPTYSFLKVPNVTIDKTTDKTNYVIVILTSTVTVIGIVVIISVVVLRRTCDYIKYECDCSCSYFKYLSLLLASV